MSLGLGPEAVDAAVAEYRGRWGIGLRVIDSAAIAEPFTGFVVQEALRWGEPTVTPREDGRCICWAMPLTVNALTVGALWAEMDEGRALTGSRPGLDVRAACDHLREMCGRLGLTNMALLDARREEYQSEQRRAYAIHDFKIARLFDLRGLYQLEESRLVSALSRGDRAAAVEVLNRLLVAILHHAGGRFDLVRSLFMELVVTLGRTAVEAGGGAEELLGANFAAVAELSAIEDDERLADWLRSNLERLMDAIERHRTVSHTAVVRQTLELIDRRIDRPVSRNDAARAVHLSPAHFSRLFKRETGISFIQALNRRRIDRAAELLARSERTLKEIAQLCGFSDQSYFTRVFVKHLQTTPAAYRRRAVGRPPMNAREQGQRQA